MAWLKSRTKQRDMCEVCVAVRKILVPPVFVCTECDLRMCEECKTKHANQPAFNHHQMEPIPFLNINIKCHKHSEKSAKNWCIKCEKAICNMCLTGFHDGHETKSIYDTLSQLQQNQAAVVTNIERHEQDRKKISETIQLLKKELSYTVYITERQRHELVKLLTSRTDDLISGIKDKYMSQVTKLKRDLEVAENNIRARKRWILLTKRKLFSDHFDRLDDFESLLNEVERMATPKTLVLDKPRLYKFLADQSLNVGEIVETSPVISRNGDVNGQTNVSKVWQADVGDVSDIQFISCDTLCCVKRASLHLYTTHGAAGSFRLLWVTPLDDHFLNGAAAAGDSHLYVTCGSKMLGGCGTVHHYDMRTHRFLAHRGQWRDGMFTEPMSIAVSPTGIIAIAECCSVLPNQKSDISNQPRVFLYRSNGSHILSIDLSASVTNPRPRLVNVAMYSPTAETINPAFVWPTYLTWDHTGRLVISDMLRMRISVFVSDQLMTSIDFPCHNKNGEVFTPNAVCVDLLNNILVADTDNKRLTMFDYQGEFLRHPLSDQLRPITKPKYVDIVDQGDRRLLLVGDEDGKIKIFTT